MIATDPITKLAQASATECPFCLGRQPIYDAARQIRGYELLYRHRASDTEADVLNPDQASASVVLKAFLELGLPRISPAQPVFVNCTRALLSMDPILPADSCVLELLEQVPADSETIQAVIRLKGSGYRLALDDFEVDDAQAAAVSRDPRYEAYMVGLLSALDSILDIPLETVIASLPLDPVIKDAILLRSGPLGNILDAVLAYESGRFELAARDGLDLPLLERTFWEAAEYSTTMLAGLAASQTKSR